ncbi:MAG: hypothetical protein PHG05_04920 [Candidatus Nanoarchaeia archaeon]|nr:hypothetical protein [Candidatus Nanoarchaeia archaeon]
MDGSIIYLPTLATFKDDIEISYNLLEPFKERDYKTGLMLISRGEGDLTPENIKLQIENLKAFIKDKDIKIFFMFPNKPLDGPNRLNFLNNQKYSIEYISKGINFVNNLYEELGDSVEKLMSFHTNSLTLENFPRVNYEEEWDFVKNGLEEVLGYAKERNVSLGIENVPVPEFGDIKKDENSLLRDSFWKNELNETGKNEAYWCDLGNPFPIFPWRGLDEIRDIGFRWVLDTCHLKISYKVLEFVFNNYHNKDSIILSEIFNTFKGIDFHDISRYWGHKEGYDGTLISRVTKFLKEGDIIQLNNSRGIYNPFENPVKYHKEGIALDGGDISTKDMEKIIKKLIKGKYHIVLELNETDFKNRPNTKKSIDFMINVMDQDSKA